MNDQVVELHNPGLCILLPLAPSQARPEPGYSDVPLLYGESPVG